MSTRHIQSALRIAQNEVEGDIQIANDQISYLSDKLSKMFHALRQFNDTHGRDLSPEVLDAFNAAWRNHEASFDTWQSYQKTDPKYNLENTFDLE
jgi:hypothetical protein